MAGNKALHKASVAKEDEFYTRLEDIEKELKHYKDHFRDKTVLCNCDDPYESNFFKYFAMNFNHLGLKKLISTSYVTSPIARVKFVSPHWLGGDEVKHPYRIDITEVEDYNGDGAVDLSDVEYLLKNDANTSTLLKGDGDFRSKECLAALDEADIVVTNPPFSLFREYVATLIEHNKKFLIIGNQNAITYKEFFPLLKNNKVWLGYHNGDMSFRVPDTYEERKTRYWIDEFGQKWRSLGTISWFTNLDIQKRHEPLDLIETYSPEKYPKYDNYDAIEVSRVADIPKDYFESMGVPITFMDRFCPEQFEIVGFRKGDDGKDLVYTRESTALPEDSDKKERLAMILSGLGVPREAMEWRNGVMGVPVTFLDKYAPEQFEILGLDRYIEDNPHPSHRFLLRERDVRTGIDKKERMRLMLKGIGIPENEMCWCNGLMGVPITIMDKYSPEQFEIVGLFNHGLDGSWDLAKPTIGGILKFKRIAIRRM